MKIRHQAVAARLGGLLGLIGLSHTCLICCAGGGGNRRTWTSRKPMNTKHISTVTLLATAFLFILATQASAETWINKADLPASQHVNGGRDFGVAALNGKFYTVGGLNWPNAISTVLEYDPTSDAWTNKANLLVPHYAPAAASANGKLYAIGGVNESGVLASVEE